MIVVTTPTGTIGRQVLQTVLDSGESIRVVARDPARLPADVHERAEVVAGSHADADVVGRAFEGADSVFWLVPPIPRADHVLDAYLDFTRPASEAFAGRGVKRVVGVSALGRGAPGDTGLVAAALAMDDLIAGTGVAYRALTLPSFMENTLRQVEAIRSRGVFYAPFSPDRRHPICATRDIAAVAAGLLLDHSWSGREDVPVLGPEDLSQNDMAQIISDVLGRPVRYEQVSIETYRAGLVDAGLSEAMAQGMVDMLAAKENGLDNAEPRTPAATSPTGFRQWCEEVLKPAVPA